MNIQIIGGGIFGTAIAISLRKKHNVSVYDSSKTIESNITKHNNFGFSLSKNIHFGKFDNPDLIFVTVPSMSIAKVKTVGKTIILTKGYFKGRPIYSYFKNSIVMAGPTLARELIAGVKTTFIASDKLPNDLFKKHIHIKIIKDKNGISIAGLFKNVLALIAGFYEVSKDLNEQAVIITELVTEFVELAKLEGIKIETMLSEAFLGDVLLCILSPKSRNNSLGRKLGRGESLVEAKKEINSTTESLHGIKEVKLLKKKHNLKMPNFERFLHECKL